MVNYTTYRDLLITVSDGIATVTMNRPPALNAWTEQMATELESVWLDLDRDPDVRAVVLTGAGRAFSAGGDLHGFQAGSYDPLRRDVFGETLRTVNNLLSLRVPLVAAVNGDAIGGAATIALMCDAVFMAHSARIGDPHVQVGVVAGDGGAALWSMLAGPVLAKRYLMSGDLLAATEAERIGLVSHVVGDGESTPEHATAYARRLIEQLPPLAVNWTKFSVNAHLRRQLQTTLETSLALECLTLLTSDRREAVAAMLEKRQPTFEGR